MDTYWPSESSAVGKDGKPRGACLRSNWYRLSAKELGLVALPTKPSTRWAGELGKAVEKLLIEQWKQMGIWVDNSIKFYDAENNISGEIDCIVRNPETNQLLVIENKTFWNYQATKEIVGNTWQKGKPKDQHLMQLMIYLDQLKGQIDEGRLTYEARDSAKKAEFVIKLREKNGETFALVDGTLYTDFSLEDVYRRFRELKQYHLSKVPPPRDYQLEYTDEQIEQLWQDKQLSKTKYEAWQKKGVRPGDWLCNGYCPWTHVCWNKQIDPTTEDTD